jgi:6-phosphogluconate dehydrogenase
MNTNQCDIGLIGLGVMGENLVLNMESKGFSVAVFNRTTEVTEKFAAGRAQGKNMRPTLTLEEFVGALKKPRIAMMMVKAGQPVDSVIGQLAPLLEKGDVIIDGGNSLFADTQRRERELESTGIHFVGMGVSGGEEGALKGPSLMPGGPRESWEIIAPIFRKIAAQVNGEPCCRYMGPDGAGHYVKMVHNGIEYGDIQLICEAYAILKDILGMDAAQLADIFAEWNRGELESYLIEITSGPGRTEPSAFQRRKDRFQAPRRGFGCCYNAPEQGSDAATVIYDLGERQSVDRRRMGFLKHHQRYCGGQFQARVPA